MTDKERLEEMEELLNDYYENIDDPFATTDIAMGIVDKVGYFVNRVQQLERFKKYFDEMYGIGLEVAEWHQNGDLELFDNFYEAAIEEMEDKSYE